MSAEGEVLPGVLMSSDAGGVSYALVDDGHALVIDPGRGTLARALHRRGVRVEWLLHTHHHREQSWCSAAVKAETGARIAVPSFDRYLFEDAQLHWRVRRVFDRYDGRSTWNAPLTTVPVDATLDDYEVFEWRGNRLLVLPAKGHTGGSVSLVFDRGDTRAAFVGDLIRAGGHVHELHAMEFMYGCLEGLLFTLESTRALLDEGVALMLPAHGPPIEYAASDIELLEQRIMAVARLGRGAQLAGIWSTPEEAFMPSPRLHEISPHLYWGGPTTCSNFYIVVSESRRALFIDYGTAHFAHMHVLADYGPLDRLRFVAHHLRELERELGIIDIDVVIPTHIHDDHTCGIPFLQRRYGTRCVALEQVAAVLEDPAAWADQPCLIETPIPVATRVPDQATFDWEDFSFTFRHAPGQTEYHSIVSTVIDGRAITFTGDNVLLADHWSGGERHSRPYQPTVMGNSFRLEMHLDAARALDAAEPELVCPGHGELIEWTSDSRKAYHSFIADKQAAFEDLVPPNEDGAIDRFWCRLSPHLCSAQAGGTIRYQIHLRGLPEWRPPVRARVMIDESTPLSAWTEAANAAGDGSAILSLVAALPSVIPTGRIAVAAEVEIGDSTRSLVEALVDVVDVGTTP